MALELRCIYLGAVDPVERVRYRWRVPPSGATTGPPRTTTKGSRHIMELKITGRVTRLLEIQTGEGRNGPWRKQDFILETEGQYPKQICVTQWGDNIDSFGITEGEVIVASIDIASREYNGRWYTDVKAWRVERSQEGGGAPTPPADEPWPSSEPTDLSEPEDDLPF